MLQKNKLLLTTTLTNSVSSKVFFHRGGMYLNKRNLIYGLDDKIQKIEKYCKKFLDKDDDFNQAKRMLSITPTFLFYGLPGTGKTTTAYEIYNQLKKHYNIDLAPLRMDELISQNFGESSKNLIAFFEQVKKNNQDNHSYTYVIIDELDSFTFNRYQNDNESIKRVLLTFNTIIDEMSLKGDLDKMILVATTNMKESIDASVLRRFFFHEDFNIHLNKEEFFKYINEIKSICEQFASLENENIETLFDIYEKKSFTLGEIKTIFAHAYMDWEESGNQLDLNIFEMTASFSEIVSKQKGVVEQ